MNQTNKNICYGWLVLILFTLVLADQILKFYIKTNFYIGQEQPLIGNWFKLLFIENPGMAFGIHFGDGIGKILLTFIRIVAIVLITYFIYKAYKKKEHPILLICLTMVLAGALGNLIDSVFYGVIFSESDYFIVARFLPPEGGYAPLLKGKVVDMFFFNVYWPSWFPIVGGQLIFPPIFNLADSYITIAVITMLIFYKKIFPPVTKQQTGKNSEHTEKSLQQ